MDQQALAEYRYRYRAVREVLGGSPIGEVAQRYGTSRQSRHAWRRRFEAAGMPGLVDRSRRPRSSPGRMPAEVEALICRLRWQHGARSAQSWTICARKMAAGASAPVRVLVPGDRGGR